MSRRLLAAALLLLACARPRLALAPELADAPVLAVKATRRAEGSPLAGRSAGTLAFGAHAVDWERAATQVLRAAPGPGASCGTRGAFSFALRGGALRVRCEEQMDGTSLAGSGAGHGSTALDGPAQHRLQCALPGGALLLSDAAAPGARASADGSAGYGDAEPPLHGELRQQGLRLQLEPAFPPGSFWGHAWGFTLRAGGRAVAAVQTQEPRGVWLAPGLPAPLRDAAVTAAAALLLADPGWVHCSDLVR